jgi:hypothetical protein
MNLQVWGTKDLFTAVTLDGRNTVVVRQDGAELSCADGYAWMAHELKKLFQTDQWLELSIESGVIHPHVGVTRLSLAQIRRWNEFARMTEAGGNDRASCMMPENSRVIMCGDKENVVITGWHEKEMHVFVMGEDKDGMILKNENGLIAKTPSETVMWLSQFAHLAAVLFGELELIGTATINSYGEYHVQHYLTDSMDMYDDSDANEAVMEFALYIERLSHG